MLLVPRQLQRAGMTGDVPYYGGRLTPAHIDAITHPAPQSLPPQAPPETPTQAPAETASLTEKLESLQHLLKTGVLSQSEYDALRARVLA
jgi:hypothetical protein